jgi:hypothetical protein
MLRPGDLDQVWQRFASDAASACANACNKL